jgi:hypothetical protein
VQHCARQTFDRQQVDQLAVLVELRVALAASLAFLDVEAEAAVVVARERQPLLGGSAMRAAE